MPSPKSHRRGSHEKNRKGRLSEKSSSFHDRGEGGVAEMLLRPRTVPDLLDRRVVEPPRLTKLLLNVTIQRSLGAVHVLMAPDATVGDLITAALRQYLKEARRPVLPTTDASAFGLHYSQFCLESLDWEQKVMELGSRNFFLCPKETAAVVNGESGGAAVSSSCSKEAEKASKKVSPWLKLIDFLL